MPKTIRAARALGVSPSSSRISPSSRASALTWASRAGPSGNSAATPCASASGDAASCKNSGTTFSPRIRFGSTTEGAVARARAALAASGTVSLELALAGVPMVVAYRVGKIEEMIVRALATAPSVVLPNLILGENVVPEFLQDAASPEALAQALCALLPDGPARAAQVGALGRLDGLMRLEGGDTPSARAARIVLEMAR